LGIDLVNYEQKAREAVQAFWGNREAARLKQIESGKNDQGSRSSVTAGKNMDGFLSLFLEVIKANGLGDSEIHLTRTVVTLPGFFRPTKQWDLLVVYHGELVAAIELKSQVGSFGNNFNNRTEEAIGTAHDFWTAYREGAFGEQPTPFAGWLILVEECEKSLSPVRDKSPHFPIFQEFTGASYLKRYDLLCQKLIKEQLYTCATVISSPRSAADSGEYHDHSSMTSLRAFVTSLAGHIAARAVRFLE